MFKLKKILCFVISLSIASINVTYAGFANDRIIKNNPDGTISFIPTYEGFFETDYPEGAIKSFIEKYKTLKLTMDGKSGLMLQQKMKEDCATVSQYIKAVLNQVEETGQLKGWCFEFSEYLSKILTEFGLKNYLIYVQATDPKKENTFNHTANLFYANGEWYVADAIMEKRGLSYHTESFLYIPLDSYDMQLTNVFGFRNIRISVLATSPSDPFPSLLSGEYTIPIDQLNNKMKF